MEMLFVRVVAVCHFFMQRRLFRQLTAALDRSLAAERTMRAMTVVIELPLLQSQRQLRVLQVNRRIELDRIRH